MIRIIPAIDIIDGKCVRLTKGDYSQKKIYNQNPVEVAKEFESVGIQYLHLVDLDGAKAGRIINWKVLEAISKNTNLIIDFGGGLRSDIDLNIAFENGADKVTAGSIAAKNRDIVRSWLEQFGSDRIILGADCKDEMISINAWKEETNIPLIKYLVNYYEIGFRETIVTDISKDGVLGGPSFELYKNIMKEVPSINVIASGGIADIEDVNKLNQMNIFGVIIGKAIYEGKIRLNEFEKFLC